MRTSVQCREKMRTTAGPEAGRSGSAASSPTQAWSRRQRGQPFCITLEILVSKFCLKRMPVTFTQPFQYHHSTISSPTSLSIPKHGIFKNNQNSDSEAGGPVQACPSSLWPRSIFAPKSDHRTTQEYCGWKGDIFQLSDLRFLQQTVTEVATNEPQLRVPAAPQRDSAAPAITGGICVPSESRQAWGGPLLVSTLTLLQSSWV